VTTDICFHLTFINYFLLPESRKICALFYQNVDRYICKLLLKDSLTVLFHC